MRRLFLALAMTGLATTALPMAGFAVAPASAKTLVYCSEGNPESLNPQIVTTTTAMDVSRPIFNTLVDFAPGSTVVVPALAEKWTVSEDGREYTFHLRKGVRFHSNDIFRPTREMNADDVLFSFERQWKTDHPYHRVSGVRYDYFLDLGMADILSAIDKVDPYTVRFRLSRPDSVFLANIAMPFNAIHSAEYAAAMLKAGTPEIVDQRPIGTGPFAFISYQRDLLIRFVRFGEFWGDAQPIDSLVFTITPNPAVRLTKLKSGECHLMAFPNPADVNKIAADPNLVLLKKEELNIGYLSMNTTMNPLDDVRLRIVV
jgi:dipeptide transport system substrate-binding protein